MQIFKDDSFSNLIRSVNEKFLNAGFSLGAIYLDVIESARHRTEQERNYEYYLGEVFGETCALKYPWTPKIRSTLSDLDKSGYLNFSASEFDCEGLTLDPNMHLILKYSTGQRFDFLQQLRRWKQAESERFPEYSKNATQASDNQIIFSLTQIAKDCGFGQMTTVPGRNRGFRFEAQAANKEVAAIIVPDIDSVIRRGFVLVQYVLSSLPVKRFGIDQFVPGGYLYSEWNKSVSEILFAFYAQCRFALSLDEALKKSQSP